jgi:hypothetical protein
VRDEAGEWHKNIRDAMNAAHDTVHELYGTGIQGSLVVEAADGSTVGEVQIGLVRPKHTGEKHGRRSRID